MVLTVVFLNFDDGVEQTTIIGNASHADSLVWIKTETIAPHRVKFFCEVAGTGESV